MMLRTKAPVVCSRFISIPRVKSYLVTAFVFLIIGGLEALVMRLQLAGPNKAIISPETYYQIFSMHGITMIFWYAGPILSGSEFIWFH